MNIINWFISPKERKEDMNDTQETRQTIEIAEPIAQPAPAVEAAPEAQPIDVQFVQTENETEGTPAE